jgi:hypothetical protein
MLDFSDVFDIGTAAYSPHVANKKVKTQCPDCLGEKSWTITMPSGVRRKMACPRCDGDHIYLPHRYERTLEIREITITNVEVRWSTYRGDLSRSVRYETTPACYGLSEKNTFLTREEAEAAGAILLAEAVKDDESEWREEVKRAAEQSGQKILTVFRNNAERKAKKLEEKIDTLRDKMLEAIKFPSLYGPKVTSRTYSVEITAQNMADWFSQMLSESDIEGWSDEELHEALCQC